MFGPPLPNWKVNQPLFILGLNRWVRCAEYSLLFQNTNIMVAACYLRGRLKCKLRGICTITLRDYHSYYYYYYYYYFYY